MTGAQPWASENAYLLDLSSAELWGIAFADTPEEAERYHESWTRQKSRYDALDQELARLQEIAADQVGGLGHDQVQEVVTLRRAQLRQLLDQASENAAVWASAATALREAQASMRRLASRSEAATIIYNLAEEYTNLGLRLLGPLPVGEALASPTGRRVDATAAFPLAAAALSTVVPRSIHPRVPAKPAERLVAEQRREAPTVKREHSDSPPATQPAPAAMPIALVAPLPPLAGSPALDVTQRPEELSSGVDTPDIPRLPAWAVGRPALCRAVAELLVASVSTRAGGAQAGMPAVVSIRATNGQDAVTMLRAVRAEVREALAAQPVRGLHTGVATLEVGGLTCTADLWRALGDALSGMVRATRPWLRYRIRHAVTSGTLVDRSARLREAMLPLRRQGWLPVIFVEGLATLAPDLAHRLASVMLALGADDAATAIFVVAVDSPLHVIARSVVAGAPYPSALVQVVSHGLDVPPPSAEDLDNLRPEFVPAGPVLSPWRPASSSPELDGMLWDAARAELVAETSLASATTVLLLWSLYLRVLDTGPLGGEQTMAHSRFVLRLARIVVRWVEARLQVPTLAGVSLERAMEPAGEPGDGAGRCAAEDLLHPALVELRSAASIDADARALAARLT